MVKHHHPMEGTSNSKANNNQVLERRARPQKDQALNCPRCNSTNTKFCYYNNYSLSQPRYFCKTCRRYWTEGGSLRNVPVGGGSRKNKRSTPSSSTTTTTTTPSITTSSSQQEASKNKLLHPDLITTTTPTPNINTFPHIHQSSSHQNPKIQYQGQDLNLAYPPPPDHQDYNHLQTSAMELLKTGISTSSSSTRGLNYSNFMPPTMSLSESSPMYNNNNNSSTIGGFPPLQDFKAHQGLSFSLEGFENGGFGSSTLHGIHQENGGARILFPVVEDLKQQVPNSTTTTASQGDSSTHHGYWNGMLGGGSW